MRQSRWRLPGAPPQPMRSRRRRCWRRFWPMGAAFFAFALMAERRKLTTEAQGRKSIYYLAGLAEGAETIVIFALMMVFPEAFPALAYGFACLVAISAGARLVEGLKLLGRP
jgi:hypothetical protein